MALRACFGLLLALSLTACKLQISVPEGGRVVGQSLTCRANTVCTVDVSTTSFDQTYRAIPAADRYTFTGWERGDRLFCGGKTGPCRLTTTLFGDNATLLAFLGMEDEVFYLAPKFEELSDNLPSGAKPIKLAAKSVYRGELGARKVSYDEDSFFGAPIDDSDYFVFVAPTTGALTIKLDELAADFDLSLESADRILEISDTVGTKAETISAQVTEGSTYYIAVYAFDEIRSDYRLTVSFEAFRPADAPANIAGTYIIEPSDAFGFCLVDGPILVANPPSEFAVAKSGKFVETVDGFTEDDTLRIYQEYNNDLPNRTVIRRDVYRIEGTGGAPELILEVLITGEFVTNAIRGERMERFIFFDGSGQKMDDCLLSSTFLGRKLAGSSGSDDKSLSP